MLEQQRSGVLLALDASVGETGWAVVDSGSSRMVEATGVIKTPAPRKSALDSRVDVLLADLDALVQWWRAFGSGPEPSIAHSLAGARVGTTGGQAMPVGRTPSPAVARLYRQGSPVIHCWQGQRLPGQLELRGHGTTWPDWPEQDHPRMGSVGGRLLSPAAPRAKLARRLIVTPHRADSPCIMARLRLLIGVGRSGPNSKWPEQNPATRMLHAHYSAPLRAA